jgi:hypothetical protein
LPSAQNSSSQKEDWVSYLPPQMYRHFEAGQKMIAGRAIISFNFGF